MRKISKKQFIEKSAHWWIWVILCLAIFIGLYIRLYDLDDLPLDFHPTRQLHSLIIARGMYYQNLDDAPSWQREFAITEWQEEEKIELPIMESLTALVYRLVGQEDLRVPRILAISFWMIGGLGLFQLINDMLGFAGAATGLAYYLLLPYGISASRSFQPEPLMIASIIWAWWAIWRWKTNPSWKWTIIAGLLTGFAILVKSPAVFFLLPVWVTLVLSTKSFVQAIKSRKTWVIVLLASLPTVIYTVYGLFIEGFLGSQFSLRFFPNLWVDFFYYRRWKDLIDNTMTLELFLMGLLGAFLIRERTTRKMVISMWIGYVFYGLIFAYHIHSHDYYQLPQIPVVAIGLASFVAFLTDHLEERKGLIKAIICGIAIIWMLSSFTTAYLNLRDNNYRSEGAFWKSLGDKVCGSSVISMTQDYGGRLYFWGWVNSTHWMSSYDFEYRELAGNVVDREALFNETIKGMDYFLITAFGELEKQPYIKDTLVNNYEVLDSSSDFVIFDLNAPLEEQSNED